MVEPDHNGALRISKPLSHKILSRQKAPFVLEHVASIYVLDPDYLRRANHLLDGHTEGYNIGVEKSLDVDSNFDFSLIEFLLWRKTGHPSFTDWNPDQSV